MVSNLLSDLALLNEKLQHMLYKIQQRRFSVQLMIIHSSERETKLDWVSKKCVIVFAAKISSSMSLLYNTLFTKRAKDYAP